MMMMMSAASRGAEAAVEAKTHPVVMPAAVPVFFDHDGGGDDLVALVYLLKHQHR